MGRRQPRRPYLLYAAALAALVSGCAQPVIRTGALPNYARLRSTTLMGEGDGRARTYVAPGLLLLDYDVLYVKPVKPAGQVGPDQPRISQYCAHLQERTLNGLRKLRKFRILTTDDEFLNRKRYDLRVATLELFITHLDEGNGFVRYVVGFERGGVDVQVEGRLTDARTGEVLMEFADRRYYAGDPMSGLNVRVIRPEPLVEEVLIQHAYAVVKLINSYP